MPFDLTYMPEVGSTNRVAGSLTGASFRPGVVVLTDYQSAGRGRRERAWLAPARTALLMSLVLGAPRDSGDALLLVALSVSDALNLEGLDARIKWPNDILVNEKKVCGILAERVARDSHYVIVGCGINVLAHPDVPGAGSLSAEAGRHVDRSDLAVAILRALDRWCRALAERPDSVFEEWRARLDTLGSRIVVSDDGPGWTGTAVGVERSGGLRVLLDDGRERTVLAGDVSIRTDGDFTTT